MTDMTPDGLTFGSGKPAKPAAEPMPAISGHAPLILRLDDGSTTEIPAGGRLVAGSSADADLTLPGMTGQHGVFYVLAGEWHAATFTAGHSWLVKPGPAGDTDEPLFGPTALRRGDRVKFGTVTFRAEAPA